jgi:hypothetical protein
MIRGVPRSSPLALDAGARARTETEEKMNNKLFAIRKTAPLMCVWMPSGNAKSPLVCVWTDVPEEQTGSSASSDDTSAGLHLCA